VLAAQGVGAELVEAQLAGIGGPVARCDRPSGTGAEPRPVDRRPLARADFGGHARSRTANMNRAGNRCMAPLPCPVSGPMTRLSPSACTPEPACQCRDGGQPVQLRAARLPRALITTAAENATAIADIIHRPAVPAGAIEQAKGALMGLVRCDAGPRVEHDAPRQPGVQRETAGIGGCARRAHQRRACRTGPTTGTPITPDDRTREAAGLMWAAPVGSTATRSSFGSLARPRFG